jgi:hydroxymethylbilane synthase
MKLRIGTRGSDLALAQAHATARALRMRGHDVEVEILKTRGDADQTSRFEAIGQAGLFVRELERALQDERVDLAVHSYKDLPSDSPSELVIAAVPQREDPRDRLLVRAERVEEGASELPLRNGARVGTAAARRTALLKDLRPDIEPVLLRGNVPTRVRKLREGEYDAILLAASGLDRLDAAAGRGECEKVDRTGLVEVPMDVERFVPAPSQGALALQVRAADQRAIEAVSALDEPRVHRAVTAERALLALIQAGCEVPFGAHCRALDASGEELELLAALEEGGALRRVRVTGTEPREMARAAFAELLPERART